MCRRQIIANNKLEKQVLLVSHGLYVHENPDRLTVCKWQLQSMLPKGSEADGHERLQQCSDKHRG